MARDDLESRFVQVIQKDQVRKPLNILESPAILLKNLYPADGVMGKGPLDGNSNFPVVRSVDDSDRLVTDLFIHDNKLTWSM